MGLGISKAQGHLDTICDGSSEAGGTAARTQDRSLCLPSLSGASFPCLNVETRGLDGP